MAAARPARDLEAALRKSEAKLRALFDESRDMILSIDSAGTITDINIAGVRLLGFESPGQVIGRVEKELWSNPSDHDVFLRLIGENGYVENFEVILTRRDGATIFGLESATLVREGTGGLPEIHAIVMDITARIHDEQAMWKLNVDLAEANRKIKESQVLMVQQEKLASIGQLAAGIAHEINNPLGFLVSNYATLGQYVGAVKDFLRCVEDQDHDLLERARETFRIDHILADLEPILQDCDDGFRRIADIVLNLKDFSRLDSGETRAAFDVNAGIQGALTVAHNEVKYVADVTLELAELPPLECVQGEIMQVLLNIILNAAQAIKSQGRPSKGRIAIRTGSEAGMIWIEVEDNGPGIPREIQTRVFDPFFTTKPVGQGTGLGLSISYEIVVNKHGGKLSLKSEPGHGACFRIELPLRDTRDADAGAR